MAGTDYGQRGNEIRRSPLACAAATFRFGIHAMAFFKLVGDGLAPALLVVRISSCGLN
jgi:hypothetical protein